MCFDTRFIKENPSLKNKKNLDDEIKRENFKNKNNDIQITSLISKQNNLWKNNIQKFNIDKHKNYVYHSNELSKIACNFTLEEQKCFYFVLRYLNPFKNNLTKFRLSKKLFFEYLGLSNSTNNYERYSKIIDGLMNKTFFKIPEIDGILKGIVFVSTKWYDNKQYFDIRLNIDFMPYLVNLAGQFTQLQLDILFKFKSVFSICLYRYIQSWGPKQECFLSETKLKELFNLNEDSYVYDGAFKRSIFETKTIKVAIKEINSLTNMKLNYVKIKNSMQLNYQFTWNNN